MLVEREESKEGVPLSDAAAEVSKMEAKEK
jgi:hypothetical protein